MEGFRLNNEIALQAAETWKNFSHPGVVPLKDIFNSKEFGDVNCILSPTTNVQANLYFQHFILPTTISQELTQLSTGWEPVVQEWEELAEGL